jgi:hypothetical protein
VEFRTGGRSQRTIRLIGSSQRTSGPPLLLSSYRHARWRFVSFPGTGFRPFVLSLCAAADDVALVWGSGYRSVATHTA